MPVEKWQVDLYVSIPIQWSNFSRRDRTNALFLLFGLQNFGVLIHYIIIYATNNDWINVCTVQCNNKVKVSGQLPQSPTTVNHNLPKQPLLLMKSVFIVQTQAFAVFNNFVKIVSYHSSANYKYSRTRLPSEKLARVQLKG